TEWGADPRIDRARLPRADDGGAVRAYHRPRIRRRAQSHAAARDGMVVRDWAHERAPVGDDAARCGALLDRGARSHRTAATPDPTRHRGDSAPERRARPDRGPRRQRDRRTDP